MFLVFFCFGCGEREEESEAKGGDYLFRNREGGMVSEEGRQGGAHQRWEGVARRGGGLNIIFRRGLNAHQVCFRKGENLGGHEH